MSTSGLTDWVWGSFGDLMLDGTGDIAVTDPTTLQSIIDMVNTRLKATRSAWQLYPIGANLDVQLGQVADAELEITLRRQVQQSLTNQFLPNGSFQVQSLRDNGNIYLFVYLNNTLIAQAAINNQTSPNVLPTSS